MASRKRPFCGRAADVAPDRGYFRPQNPSLKPAVSTILIDIFGTREDIPWGADRCSGEERRLFFGIPDHPDGLARQYTFTRSDQDLVAARRRRRQSAGLCRTVDVASPSWDGVGAHGGAGRRSCRVVGGAARDSCRRLCGLRGSAADDDRPCAQARDDARLATAQQRRPALHDRGGGAIRLEHGSGAPIVVGVIAAQRTAKIILPAPAVVERTAIAGRARARKRGADALLADLPPAQLAKLDALLIPDPAFAATPLAWLRKAPTAPKPDHVRALLDRLRRVREIGIHPRLPGGSMKTAFSGSSARHASPMRIRWGPIPCSDGARSLSPR